MRSLPRACKLVFFGIRQWMVLSLTLGFGYNHCHKSSKSHREQKRPGLESGQVTPTTVKRIPIIIVSLFTMAEGRSYCRVLVPYNEYWKPKAKANGIRGIPSNKSKNVLFLVCLTANQADLPNPMMILTNHGKYPFLGTTYVIMLYVCKASKQ